MRFLTTVLLLFSSPWMITTLSLFIVYVFSLKLLVAASPFLSPTLRISWLFFLHVSVSFLPFPALLFDSR